MKKYILQFGFLASLASIAWFIISFGVMGFTCEQMEESTIIGYGTMFLSCMIMAIGVYRYRENELGGSITFKKALSLSILMAIVSACCYTIAWKIEEHFFIPDFFDRYAEFAKQQLENSSKPADEIANELKEMNSMMELYKNPVMNILFTFMESFVVLAPASFIIAGIFSRKKKTIQPA